MAQTYGKHHLSCLPLVLRLINSFTIADGACEARSRSDEESDALSSPTNRDDEVARNPHRPEGLRRNGPVFVVAPVTMNEHCSLVAPRIRGHCARNDGKAIYETQH